MTATPTSCSSEAPGRSRPGCRSCGIKGSGVFEDVTIASGLGEPISTESAVWGDYDNDGLARSVRLRRVPRRQARPRAAAAGSTTTRATARSTTSPPRPGVTDGDCQGIGLGRLRRRRPARPLRLEPGRALPALPQRRERHLSRRRQGTGRRRAVSRPLVRLLVLGLRQ